MRNQQQDQMSRALNELSLLVLNMIRSPPSPIGFSDATSSSSRSRSPAFPSQITPAGFASMLLGMSLALMLCGSVTFFIGFMLMPWVFGLAMVFYVVGFVSTISVLGRALFCSFMPPPSSPRKDTSGK